MGRRPAKAKKKNLYGIAARTFPATVRQYVDWDYLKLLSDEERAWLADFGDYYYGGDFRSDTEQSWETAERRKSYRAKNAANRCTYGISKAMGMSDPLEDPVASGPLDATPVPTHLGSVSYKQTLARWRDVVDRKVDPASAEYRRAEQSMRLYRPKPEPEEDYDP